MKTISYHRCRPMSKQCANGGCLVEFVLPQLGAHDQHAHRHRAAIVGALSSENRLVKAAHDLPKLP
jgi:hypothetical protein